MAKPKTVWTNESVEDFINAIPDDRKRADSWSLIGIMKEETGYEPKMWGPTIVGFGAYHYKYASGHEGDAPMTGFSPRKDAFSLYLMPAVEERGELLQRLGKHKAAVACIYVKKLEDIDEKVLREMIKASIEHLNKLYPAQ